MRSFKQYIPLYIMLIPSMAFFIIFLYYPLGLGTVMSFQDFSLIGENTFVGLQNYMSIFTSLDFWGAMWNTLILGTGVFVIGFVAAIIVALSLNEIASGPFKKVSQMIIYMPHLFSWVVVAGIWIFMLSPDTGIVNVIINWITGYNVPFMTNGQIARGVFIFVAIWKDVGFNCILFLASIVGINPNLYEAAEIDGANRWRKIFNITLPQLIPTMKTVSLLMIMNFMKLFEQVYIMRNSVIKPDVNVAMTYVFDEGINNFNMDIAAATSIVMLLVTLIATMVLRRAIRFD